MSRLFGEMRQIAFVVRDLDQAVRYWTETLGVGPFFLIRDFVPIDYRYREEPAPAPRLISGKLPIENLDIQFPPSMAEETEAVA